MISNDDLFIAGVIGSVVLNSEARSRAAATQNSIRDAGRTSDNSINKLIAEQQLTNKLLLMSEVERSDYAWQLKEHKRKEDEAHAEEMKAKWALEEQEEFLRAKLDNDKWLAKIADAKQLAIKPAKKLITFRVVMLHLIIMSGIAVASGLLIAPILLVASILLMSGLTAMVWAIPLCRAMEYNTKRKEAQQFLKINKIDYNVKQPDLRSML